jgi:hypothetical protein
LRCCAETVILSCCSFYRFDFSWGTAMTQIFLVYAPDDQTFAERLTADLRAQDLEISAGDSESNEQFAALHRATHVIVVLSEAALKDTQVISTLSTAGDLKQKVVAVRTGPTKTMPRQLKGIPLDFSDPDQYQDSFDALLDDLKPPVKQGPVLPEEIQKALHSDNPVARKDAVNALGMLRNSENFDVRDLAEQTLRDLAFKDPESNIKALARSTLQLFQGTGLEVDTPQLGTPIPEPASIPLTPPHAAKTAPIAKKAVVNRDTLPLWKSPQWSAVPVFGVIISILGAWAADDITYAIAGILVWLLLPYLNVVIRDGGRMEWQMPGPVIGGLGIGLVLSFVGAIIGLIVGDADGVDIIIAAVSGSVSGGFIGWLSTLRCDSV